MPEMVMSILCREMKWDYATYQKQPAWFIDMLQKMLSIEAYETNRKLKK